MTLGTLLSVAWRRAVRAMVQEATRSLLKTATVLGGAFLLLWGMYAGASYGLSLLLAFPGVGEALALRIPGLLYLALAVMLTLSAAVTYVGVFFRAPETSFLLGLPLGRRTVVAMRWAESLILSSWAFPAVVIPFHIALWEHVRANTWYLVSFLLFLPPFATLTTAAGALAACAVVALGPLLRKLRLPLLLTLAMLLVVGGRQLVAPAVVVQEDPIFFLQNTLTRFRLAFSPWFPAGWWYLGAEALRRGDGTAALAYWSCLTTSGLFLLWVLLALAPGPVFRLWTHWAGSTPKGSPLLGQALERAMGFLPPPVRAMVLKDARLLLRDPSQWAQTALLFGLMAAYVLSLKGMAYRALPPQWRVVVVAANVVAVAGISASLGTRYFFPLPSLESRMAWVVRLAPVSPTLSLWTKVAVAMAWTLPPSLAIGAGTILMLDLPPTYLVVVALDLILMDFTLMSMSVGLGVLLPEVGHEEPAKIVSGFGGTTALLFGLAYVVLAAVLVWVQLGTVPGLGRAAAFRAGTLALGAVSLGVSWVVLRAATTRLRTMEVTT